MIGDGQIVADLRSLEVRFGMFRLSPLERDQRT